MKMSPTGLPGLLVVLFVVFTTCVFFGVQFLWVLFGLGALGIGLAAVLSFVHSRMPKDTWTCHWCHTVPIDDQVPGNESNRQEMPRHTKIKIEIYRDLIK